MSSISWETVAAVRVLKVLFPGFADLTHAAKS